MGNWSSKFLIPMELIGAIRKEYKSKTDKIGVD